MKKILILLSMMLVVGLTFGQSTWTNHIRKHTPCITAGMPEGAPNKYWGCVQAFDTTSMVIWLWNGSGWQPGPEMFYVNSLLTNQVMADTISTELLVSDKIEVDSIQSATNIIIGRDGVEQVKIDGVSLTIDAPATINSNLNVTTYIKLTATADPPGSPVLGMMYVDTDNALYFYNGSAWKVVTLAP